jgi:glycosyltransferase involved in cell wall biosynthesis
MSSVPAMGSSKSVLLVGGDLSNGGGVNRVIRDLSTIFSERLGLETTVLALSDTPPTYEFSPKVHLELHPEAASRLGYWRLLRDFTRRNYDNVIGFWHGDNIRIALASALAGKAAILTEHTSWHHPPLRTRIARALTYRLAKAVCVLNPAELAHYSRLFSNVVLLPNPVLPPVAPAPLKKEKLIVAVGHLIDRKNFRDAVIAMGRAGLDEGWLLVIVGAGPEKDALEALVRELGLGGRVHFEAPTENIEQWYARASIMLVTSKIEVFSLVLAESMLLGTVPLAYAVDGPAFLLKDHPDLLVAPGDAEALARRLREIVRAGGLAERGQAMSAVIQGRFSEEAIAEQWRALLS